MRSIELPWQETVKLVFDSDAKLSEQDYLAFCRANPNLRWERTAEGEIVIIPPAGGDSSYRNIAASRRNIPRLGFSQSPESLRLSRANF